MDTITVSMKDGEPTREPCRPSWTLIGLLVVPLLIGARLRIANLDQVKSRSPDELVYTRQARIVLENGFAGMRSLVQSYLANPKQWQYPPPTRIGYTFLVACMMRLTGFLDERAGAYLACVASILSLGMALLIGLRFFGNWSTVFALSFLSAFPAELLIARRCWPDAVLVLSGAMLFYLTLLVCTTRQDWRALIALAAVGSGTLLIKETSVLIYAPCLFCAAWHLAIKQQALAKAGLLLGAASVCGLAGIALLASYTGGVTVPFAILSGAAHGNASLPYPLMYMTGPGYLLLLAFEALSPLTFNLALLGIIATVFAAYSPRLSAIRSSLREPRAAMILALLTIIFTTIFMLIPHWLNLRYVSPAYVPMCLFAGVAVWQLFLIGRRILHPRVLRGLAAVGLVVIILSITVDYQRFERRFVQTGINDLAVRTVLAVARN
jgi:Dolichyl-phosphate-mannose-protein mannosyltransferase